jgi:hypothetical protein
VRLMLSGQEACPGSRFQLASCGGQHRTALHRLGELVGWAAREEREALFLGAACVLCSLFCSAALVLLALLVL